MSKLRYSKDTDILLIKLSDQPIEHAEEEGPIIIHFSKENEPVLLEVQEARDFILSALSSVVKEDVVTIP